jgi:hypothetical protein
MDVHQPENVELRRDYLSALGSIRKWKTFFLILTIACLAAHMAAWGAVRFGAIEPARTPLLSDEIRTAATTQKAATLDRKQSEYAWNLIRVGLPTTEFVGRMSALLLCVSMLIAVMTGLAGRLPAAGYVRAFYWSLIVMAMLLPWERLAPMAARVPGVFVDATSLEAPPIELGPARAPSSMEQLGAGLRFIGYPLIAIALACIANRGFSKSFSAAEAKPGASIPMRVV